MTPAIDTVKKKKSPTPFISMSTNRGAIPTGRKLRKNLVLTNTGSLKTLVIQLDDGNLAVAVIPVSSMLSMKLIAKARSAKKAVMADKNLVQKATGYVLGGVSPLGQKKRIPTVIDVTARNFTTIFVSGGRRGLDIELSPSDLALLTSATFSGICQEST